MIQLVSDLMVSCQTELTTALSNLSSDNYFLADECLVQRKVQVSIITAGGLKKKLQMELDLSQPHTGHRLCPPGTTADGPTLMYTPPRMDSVHRDRSGLTQDFATQRENVFNYIQESRRNASFCLA